MARRYDSSRRVAQAAETRQRIVRAAIGVHRQQRTDLVSVALAAGVSLPTVRKHFPNKEVLFEACTGLLRAESPFPRPDGIESLASTPARVREAVNRLQPFYEERLGLTWLTYLMAGESRTLRQVAEARQANVEAFAKALCGRRARSDMLGAVIGVLSPLTYRALRVEGRLSAAAATAAWHKLIGAAIR
jgi:AcrR family transcriptional regulator